MLESIDPRAKVQRRAVAPRVTGAAMSDRYDTWREDDRDRGSAWDRSLGGRGSTSDRNRNVERDSRDVFTKDLDLPRGCERRPVRARDRVYEINGTESRIPGMGTRLLRGNRRGEHLDASGRGQASPATRRGSGQEAAARAAEQERVEPPCDSVERVRGQCPRPDVRPRRCPRSHGTRALPLAVVSVGPLRRLEADRPVGHRLASPA